MEYYARWAAEASGLVYLLDLQSGLVHFSPLWMERVLPAVNPTPLDEDNLFFWVGKDDREHVLATFRKFQEEGASPVLIEYCLYWADSLRPNLVVENWTPLFGEDGAVRGLVSTGAWRSQLPGAMPANRNSGTSPEEHLLATERVFRSAIEASSAGIWNWDLLHKEDLWWSARFYDILGYEVDDIKPSIRSIKTLLHPEDVVPVFRELKRQMSGGGAFVQECRMRHADGHYHWCQVRGSTLRDKSGKPFQITGSLLDIHDRKSSEEKLLKQGQELKTAVHESQAASRAKSEFLAIVSHELRTPINGMMAGIEILDTSFETPENKEIWEIVKTCSSTLKALINDILDIARIETGQLEIRLEDVNLLDSLEKGVEHLRLQAQGRSIRVDLEIHPSVPPIVKADQHRLRQILSHLLSNALKFTHFGKINVEASVQDEEQVVIGITDTGIGIDTADLERIFDPFEQVDSSATRSYEGVGLGLTLSRRLARTLGGDVTVHSQVGEGSTFSLILPLQTES